MVASRGLQGTSVAPPAKYPNLTYYTQIHQAVEPFSRQLGINFSDHSSTPADPVFLARAGVILVMDRATRYGLEALYPATSFPEIVEKTHLFSELTGKPRDIADPVAHRDAPAECLRVFEEIAKIATEGLPSLLGMLALGSRYRSVGQEAVL